MLRVACRALWLLGGLLGQGGWGLVDLQFGFWGTAGTKLSRLLGPSLDIKYL